MLSVVERAPIYAWLAPLLVRELDEGVWKTLGDPSVVAVAERVDPDFAAFVSRPFSEDLRDTLGEEFARLFLLPGGAPPFASAWLEGDREQLGAALSALVTRSLEALGREPVRADPWGRLPLDHVALLFDLVAAAARSDDAIDLAVARHLDEQILGDWLVPFGRTLAARAESPVYRALGGLVAALHAPDRAASPSTSAA